MDKPLISIIVPVYNVEQYLDECVTSIVNQTYENIEIILVDDGSTDNSPKMCDDWAKKDSRIKAIHKENGGASSARNAGLDMATGDYIGFVDSDDYIEAYMYEKLLEAISDKAIKICCCNTYRILKNREIQKPKAKIIKKEMDTTAAVKELILTESTSLCDKLFAASLFDDIRFPNGETNEELSLLIPLIVRGSGIVKISDALYYYREREGSVTTSLTFLNEQHSSVVYNNLKKIEKQIKEQNLTVKKSFKFFSASNAYNIALAMEKKSPNLSEKVKSDYKIYRKIMKENIFCYLFSRKSRFKDKILYLLILTKLLRPLYKMFYKNHL
ncbi:MAG: glycosyltransferase [Oscillospiraceae bacterium]|nr:glycosyltransferase [Oscillospiraceae bacterium]